MTIEIPDDWLPLIVVAAEHKMLAGRALNREDSRYAEIHEFFKAAADQPPTLKPAGAEVRVAPKRKRA